SCAKSGCAWRLVLLRSNGGLVACRRFRKLSYEKLLGDGDAKPVVLGDELADEFVQAALKNAVHAAVLQARADAARLALCRALPAINRGDRIEIAHDGFVAGRQRARHLVLEDQEVGDEPGLDAVAIDPVIGGVRRDRAQDRRPLEIIERTTDALILRQQQV